MKKIYKSILFIIFIILIVINLSGCSNKKSSELKNLEQKVNKELAYLDEEFITIANSLNNIEYVKYKVVVQDVKSSTESNKSEGEKENSNKQSETESSSSKEEETSKQQSSEKGGDSNGGQSSEQSGSGEGGQSSQEGSNSQGISSGSTSKKFSVQGNNILDSNEEIDWKKIKNIIENIYTVWTTIAIDLKEIGVSENDLMKFNETLDLVTASIKNEDKDSTLNSIVLIYEFLPKFMNAYSKQSEQVNILECKYKLLLCYKNINTEEWEELEKSIYELEKSFSNVSGKQNEKKENNINIDSAKVIINEIKNTMNIKEKEIFFIKYKNLMQEFNSISE